MSIESHNPHNPEPQGLTYPATMQQAGYSKPVDEICDWLRALGVDPKDLPADPQASMADGQLTFRRKVSGPFGGHQLLPDRSDFMFETVTVPVTTPPPPIAAIWLAPTCPTCGR